ncbi:MAG: hypothetical protein ACXADH_07480 [Candidatus Kariarchaeaceae archaeon]|jgi:hypothetical protein
MKRESLFLILLIGSLVAFIPLLEPAQSVTVIPDIKSSVLFDVHTPSIKITTTAELQIIVNVTLLDVSDETSTIVAENVPITSSKKITTDTIGLYFIEILASELAIVKIKGTGFYTPSIILTVLLGLINLYYFTRKVREME